MRAPSSKRSATTKPVDWHKVWKDQMSRCTLFARDKSGRPKQWSIPDAEKFYKGSNPQYALFLFDKIRVTSRDRVLDVGCGPGRLAVPIAKTAKAVTAVDSSEGMLHVLKEHAKKNNLRNITCINKAWREVDSDELAPKYDVTIASNCVNLLGVKQVEKKNGGIMLDWNLEDALSKLNAVSKRVYVTMSLLHHDISGAFQALGRECHSFPDYITVHNVMCQMGIKPNVNYFVTSDKSINEPRRLEDRLQWILDLETSDIAKVKDKISANVDEAERGLQIWSLLWWKN